MADAFLGVVRVLSVWGVMGDLIATPLNEAGPDFPNRLIMLMSPYAGWGSRFDGNTAARWAQVALAVTYAEEVTEEVRQSVIDALLHIVSNNCLISYNGCSFTFNFSRASPILPELWAWLKEQPPLPPICSGRMMGTQAHAVRRVRELGDVEILKSYLFLVWSEWNGIDQGGFTEMCAAIGKELGRNGMGCHREVLITRLDHILGQLDSGLEHLRKQNPTLDEDHIPTARKQYGKLRDVLVGVNEEA